MKALKIVAIVLLSFLGMLALQGIVFAVMGQVAWSRQTDHHPGPGFVLGQWIVLAVPLGASIAGIMLLLKSMRRP